MKRKLRWQIRGCNIAIAVAKFLGIHCWELVFGYSVSWWIGRKKVLESEYASYNNIKARNDEKLLKFGERYSGGKTTISDLK
jgi:hypothetical protein